MRQSMRQSMIDNNESREEDEKSVNDVVSLEDFPW